MKVAMINSVCGIRSTGRIMSQLADAVAANGDSCVMVFGRESLPRELEGKAYRMESPLGVRLHGLRARVFDGAGFGSAAATQRLLKRLDAFAPDVLHLHNLHGYYLNLPILFDYIKRKKLPVIMTLHDCWTFTGHCSHYEFAGCSRWRTGCFDCPQKGEYPASWLMDRSKQNYQRKRQLFLGVENMTLVTPSHWLAQACGESYLREYPICVIPNSIDRSRFVPMASDVRKRFGLEGKRIVLAVSSAWGDGRKGLGDITQLPELLPGDCKVVVIGVTGKEKQKLSDKILTIERTNDIDELVQWYSAADVFINPTYEDNFPTVNLEAIACGTPVVTYPSGGSPEAVTPGVTGYVTQEKSIRQLAQLSLQAMELKKKGVGFEDGEFGLEAFTRQYLSLYRQMCREKG